MKYRSVIDQCRAWAVFFCLFFSFMLRAETITNIESARAYGYAPIASENGQPAMLRWSRDYNAGDIEQLLLAAPELQGKIQSFPHSRLLLIQVDENKKDLTPVALDMAIISQQPAWQSILLSWLPFLPGFMGSDQSTGQRYEMVLSQLEETSGRYIEPLPGPIDWQHSFITDTGSNRISLSANSPRITRTDDALQALTFVEILTAPDFQKNEDQQLPSLPLSDTELKKTLGQGDLLCSGGGGDFSFRPDHRPGGGGGGAQTDNELWLSLSPLSLRSFTLIPGGQSARVWVLPEPQRQKSITVQTLSGSGVLLREQRFSAEQLIGLLGGDQPLTPEQEHHALQLARDALRIQVYGDPVQALKHLVLVEPDTSTGCFSGQIPDMISCHGGNKSGGKGHSGGGGKSGGTGGGGSYSGAGSYGFGSQSGGSGSASSGGDDPRNPRGWNPGKTHEGYVDSSDEEEEIIVRQKSKELPVDAAMAQSLRAAKLKKHQEERDRWDRAQYSQLINWAQIYEYLPNDTDIVQFMEVITNPGISTYGKVVDLIKNTSVVRWAPEADQLLLAYQYLRQGLETYISDPEKLSSQLPLVQKTVKDLKAFIDGSRGLPPDFIAVKPVGRDKADWVKLQQMAEMVFWDIPPDSPVQLTVTDGLEREVRRLIYTVLYDISEEVHNDKGILQGTAMGLVRISVSELTTKIQSESDTRKHLTLLALAMQESSELLQEKIAESIEKRKKTKTLEKNILQKIRDHLYYKWKTLGPDDHDARIMLAEFSIKVMSDSFLPKGGASAASFSPVVQPPARFRAVSGGRLDKTPTLPQLLELNANGKTIKVIQRVGVNYHDFGMLILNDDDGNIMDTLEHQERGKAGRIMQQILRKWLQGSGKPVTWRTIIQVLRQIHLSVLADDLEEALQ